VVTLIGAEFCGLKFRFNSVPLIESLKEIVVWVCKSEPRRDLEPPPKIVEKISWSEPNKSEKSAPLKLPEKPPD